MKQFGRSMMMMQMCMPMCMCMFPCAQNSHLLSQNARAVIRAAGIAYHSGKSFGFPLYYFWQRRMTP